MHKEFIFRDAGCHILRLIAARDSKHEGCNNILNHDPLFNHRKHKALPNIRHMNKTNRTGKN
jgi:hypothetical protein